MQYSSSCGQLVQLLCCRSLARVVGGCHSKQLVWVGRVSCEQLVCVSCVSCKQLRGCSVFRANSWCGYPVFPASSTAVTLALRASTLAALLTLLHVLLLAYCSNCSDARWWPASRLGCRCSSRWTRSCRQQWTAGRAAWLAGCGRCSRHSCRGGAAGHSSQALSSVHCSVVDAL